MSATLLLGSCEARLRELADCSVDAVVTDPPAGIGFMGRDWDSDKGGRDQWIAWLAGVMRECLRVLRPGGYALVWALPRTSHWTATAIEDAGFEIRDLHHDIVSHHDEAREFIRSLDVEQRRLFDRLLNAAGESSMLYHVFGSGFPKSLDVSKAMDARGGTSVGWFGSWLRKWREENGISQKQIAALFPSKTGRLTGCVANWELGLNMPTPEQFNLICTTFGLPFSSIYEAEREVVGERTTGRGTGNGSTSVIQDNPDNTTVTAPATPNARRWKGHGTALKPAVEHWILARKPLEGTYAENVLKHGTGALRIDECRIGTEGAPKERFPVGDGYAPAGYDHGTGGKREAHTEHLGRWPAHLSLSHAGGCREGACVEGCPVRTLDEQSGERKSGSRKAGVRKGIGFKADIEEGDGGPALEASTGGASRFFYIAKPSRREKDAGLEDLPAVSGGEATGRADGSAGTRSPRAGAGRTGGGRNAHPTVKAVALMRWLVRLITPPGGLVLDPFAGSGTTGVACAEEGLRFLGVEQDAKFHETARLRLRKAHGACATELPAQRDLAAVLTAQPRSEDGSA